MNIVDPATRRTLPSDAIQRILFIANSALVYNIPPLASTKGHKAASWTEDPSRHIFTARLRVIETSLPTSPASPNPAVLPHPGLGQGGLKVDIVLEDPSTGDLFAAAPYTNPNIVEPAIDSSRFFAITVRDDQGRKAVLGLGFAERPEAFDFSIGLQEARKSLGWEQQPKVGGGAGGAAQKEEENKDYSLKEGQTITVNFGAGSKFGQRKRPEHRVDSPVAGGDLQRFALAPPPAAGDVREQKKQSAKDLGFDDGQFNEFA